MFRSRILILVVVSIPSADKMGNPVFRRSTVSVGSIVGTGRVVGTVETGKGRVS